MNKFEKGSYIKAALGSPTQKACKLISTEDRAYLLFNILKLPALFSDIMKKLQSLVILLGNLHPGLL